MKIAVLGCRGIPARYGGFETLAEQLSMRLAAKGHRVVVYCRSRYADTAEQSSGAVERVVLPALYTKHCETLSHTLLSVLHQCMHRGGVVLLLNNANAIFIPLLKLAGKKVWVHVDGLEWQREKWGMPARAWHRLSERLAVRWAHGLICDSETIGDYYKKTYGRRPAYAAYGWDTASQPDKEPLKKFGLIPGQYLLFTGRMEPENHPDLILEAYRRIKESRMPLVLVGWAPYAKRFMRALRGLADARVRFLGPVYGKDYQALLAHCYAFLHASCVGGTHPALVEAMGAARPILASDIPENRETLGDAAIFFPLYGRDAEEKIRWAMDHPDEMEKLGAKAQDRARERFDWDRIADAYEKLFQSPLSL